MHGWDNQLEGKRSVKEVLGSEKEMGSLRLLAMQLTQVIALECVSHQIWWIIVYDPAGGRWEQLQKERTWGTDLAARGRSTQLSRICWEA